MAISRNASANIAQTISNYAQRSQLSLDDIRQNPDAHRGNLRAELMQATGDTQAFSAPVVDAFMSRLQGSGSVDTQAVQAAVSEVIDRQESHQQNVQSQMGATLSASQSTQVGTPRNTQNSPLSTRMGAMLGTAAQQSTAAPNRMGRAGANSSAPTGAAAGQQAASIGKKLGKWIKGGALALVVGAALTTGFMSTQVANIFPDMPDRAPIELVQQQQDKDAQQLNLGSEKVPVQVVSGGRVMNAEKEKAYSPSSQEVQQRDLRTQQQNVDDSGAPQKSDFVRNAAKEAAFQNR